MVIAAPFGKDEKNPSIIELLKDITDDGVVNIVGLGPTELNNLVSRKNESIIKDAITRIYNERHIFERLPFDLNMTRKKRSSLAVFLIRIANIEAFTNIGVSSRKEKVIKDIARVINHMASKSMDWASRYREADFLLVLHDINKNKADRICQRIRKNISNLEFGLLNKTVVEIKIGYHIVFQENSTPEQVIESASRMFSSSGVATTENTLAQQYKKIFDNHLLTEREQEVALLLASGNSNNEIAKKIFVGLSTVKKHVSSIFLKTKAKSRAEFMAKLSFVTPD